MKKISTLLRCIAFSSSLMMVGALQAQNGQPHTVTANANFDQVTVNWYEPASEIQLKWHNDYDYNGMDGAQHNPQGTCVIYVGSKFLPSELAAVAGEQVDAISYFQYRDVANVRVQLYENGVLVRDQAVDVAGFVKNSWKKVTLNEPYTITGNDEIMFVVRFEHGYNMTFVAITDKVTHDGKGNIVSYDGKHFTADGNGDFLVTGCIKNNATAKPLGYNLYRDDVKVNEALIDTTFAVLDAEPSGAHQYRIGAVYEGEEKKSYFAQAVVNKPSDLLAPATNFSASADELKGELSWIAPLKSGDLLTWSNQTLSNKIGGTSSTAPKVWIKQEFDANDLLAFQNYQINAINSYLAEPVTSATLFVIKDGVIDYSEVVDSLPEISDGQWAKFALASPYQLSIGHKYAFGVYYTHASAGHPIGVDNSQAVNVKGNSFSTSSPSSKAFNSTKPSWKTLSTGNIPGNFMLTADVAPIGEPTLSAIPTGYDIYRNGELLANDVDGTNFADSVSEPGKYTYTLVTKYADKQAPTQSATVAYTMPAIYSAPVITDSNFDEASGELSFAWSQEAAELKHYGTASYTAGFNEELSLIYGAKFTKEELSAYHGYQIKSLKFALGAALQSFKLEVINGKGERLMSEEIDGSVIAPVTFYNLTLPNPITIPSDDDLYIVYNATIPASTSAMILDGGPAVDGGAVVSLTNGASWLKLGTIASDYANYNIVISATAVSVGDSQNAKAITLGNSLGLDNMDAITINAAELKAGFGIEASDFPVQKAKAKKAAARPTVIAYKVYCNGEEKCQQTAQSYSEILKTNGEFNYYVTSIFQNGWESPASKVISINNPIPQASPAPFALKGNYTEAGSLLLSWKAANESATLTYQKDDGVDMALGMTGSGTREAYAGVRFPTDSLAAYAGKKITHISFKLASVDINSAAVFVMVGTGQDIVFEQPVPVESLQVGWNTIRLNKPFEISANQEIGFGYHTTYANGVKPHVLDAGPAVAPGLSDQISSSASAGYWYSLKTKYKQDYNWRITATLADADTAINAANKNKVKAQSTSVATYNVYRDSTLVADNLTTTQFEVGNAANGTYTVSSVVDGVESARSNAVVLNGVPLVGDINGDGIVNVSDVTALVNHILNEDNSNAEICDINGDGVVNVSDVTDLVSLML